MNRNIYIKTYEEDNLLFSLETIGNFEDNILSYATDNDTIKINLDKFSFTKTNLDSILKITPDNCTLTIKSLKQSLDIPLKALDYQIQEDNIYLKYQLISQELPLKIFITIGSEINEL